MHSNWAAILAWLSDKSGLQDEFMAALVPQPGILEGQTRGYAQHFSRARHLLAFMGWMVEEAPLIVDSDQVELPPELSTQKGPLA